MDDGSSEQLIPAPRPSPEPKPDSLAQVGFEVYINSVRTCPASDYAGAAVIAKSMMDRGLNPAEISTALLSDDAKVRQIQQAALKTHSKIQKGPRDGIRLSEQRVRETIEGNFSLAARYIEAGLSVEELERISGDLFNQFDDLDSAMDKDRMIGIIAERMIQEASVRKQEKAA